MGIEKEIYVLFSTKVSNIHRFLAEIGALHLLDDEDKCILLEDIYKKVAEGVGGCSWESFEVYRHLKSQGYIIKRHGLHWSMPARVESDSGIQRIVDNENEDSSCITRITELFNTMQINEARPVFDVYPPNSKFIKSNPGHPIFILCVNSGIGWGWPGVIWIYRIVFYFPLGIFKFIIRYAFTGKAWDNLLQNKTVFTTKKD